MLIQPTNQQNQPNQPKTVNVYQNKEFPEIFLEVISEDGHQQVVRAYETHWLVDANGIDFQFREYFIEDWYYVDSENLNKVLQDFYFKYSYQTEEASYEN